MSDDTTKKTHALRETFRASAGKGKGLVDAEELRRNIYADRLMNTRPVPILDPPDDARPPHQVD